MITVTTYIAMSQFIMYLCSASNHTVMLDNTTASVTVLSYNIHSQLHAMAGSIQNIFSKSPYYGEFLYYGNNDNSGANFISSLNARNPTLFSSKALN